jgi:hypothetical protein
VPVTRVRIKSMFTEVYPPRIAGVAWGADGVKGVSVSVDGQWHEARLMGPLLPHAWRRFELRWKLRPGRHRLVCRATDLRGESQPLQPQWNPLGYGNNSVQEIEILLQ